MDPYHHEPANVRPMDVYNETNGEHIIPNDSKIHQCQSEVPIAIVGMACRLPGHGMTPKDLWEFVTSGKVADITPPSNRFSLHGHYDGSQKPNTMKTPGAMFMEDVDPAAFDAQFFQVNSPDACSMDPQQRVFMEVAYECLENAGIPKERVEGTRLGCIVGASAVDYHDMACRDPEDRTYSPTIGCGRALLSNRVSHFLNAHGPSITVDTACSSGLTALQLACLYLRGNEADSMLVGGVNMYLSPERNQDMGAMRETASSTGYCHSFDAKADGYVIAEAVNSVLLKRFDDAVRDGDPIRGIIRGVAVNSAGKTTGIAMPNAKAQEAVIRDAYQIARIPASEMPQTGYVECHGTGTRVGDPIEVQGLSSAFNKADRRSPIFLGSVKSNIGHSEAAAGLSSIIKVVLSIENAVIPGTASFDMPNPGIDFNKSCFKISKATIPWPAHSKLRASVNSFGFGGANAHAVLESPKYLLGTHSPCYRSCYLSTKDIQENFFREDHGLTPAKLSSRPLLLVLSANDEDSLKAYATSLVSCLINPAVQASTSDLTYTLSERRSRLRHRAYAVIREPNVTKESFTFVKRLPTAPVVAFAFTGQGAQWPMMGKALLKNYQEARETVKGLDAFLRQLPCPPDFMLFDELTQNREASALRRPEVSQPLVTAVQLAYINILLSWGIRPSFVVGHSSGEIAAAYACGYISAEGAIKLAYLRGLAVQQTSDGSQLGMLAVGLSVDALGTYIDSQDEAVQIACLNSPSSITVSGTLPALEVLQSRLKEAGHFARLLQVDVAYHSDHMQSASSTYGEKLRATWDPSSDQKASETNIRMFSSVTGAEITVPPDITYWQRNLVAQVNFEMAVRQMIQPKTGPNVFIEIGPSNTLSSPIQEIFRTAVDQGAEMRYISVAKRNYDTDTLLYKVPGLIFGLGGSVDIAAANQYKSKEAAPRFLIDLPNYAWNHSKKYWKESLASKDWRQRPFVKHDLLGSKVPGTNWSNPTWRNRIQVADLPWLMDHKIGDQVVFPASGYICMAIEAMYQTNFVSRWKGVEPKNCVFRLRDAKFSRALVLDASESTIINLSLAPMGGSDDSWHEFRVTSMKSDTWHHHATGLVRIESGHTEFEHYVMPITPLRNPTSCQHWYNDMREIGMNFGPAFQTQLAVEYTSGSRTSRSMVSLTLPASKWQQSGYMLHPASMDGCFQAASFVLAQAQIYTISAAMVPFGLDELTLPFSTQQHSEALASAHTEYNGVGREESFKNYSLSCTLRQPDTGSLLLELKGLRLTEIDSSRTSSLSHTYTQVCWEADVTLLSESGWRKIEREITEGCSNRFKGRSTAIARKLVHMTAHQKPDLQVLEVNLDYPDSSCLLLDQHNEGPLETSQSLGMSRYIYCSNNASTVAAVEERHSTDGRADYTLHDFSTSTLTMDRNFDVALIRVSPCEMHKLLSALKNIRSSLGKHFIALIIGNELSTEGMNTVLNQSGFHTVACLEIGTIVRSLQYATLDISKNITLFKMGEHQTHPFELELRKSNWNIRHLTVESDIRWRERITILDEPETSVMASVNQQHFKMLQKLIRSECNILWVTKGAQMQVDNPDSAIVHGLLRVIRNESPGLNLITLDVDGFVGDAALTAVEKCLKMLNREDPMEQRQDSEFVERGGVTYISRVLPDSRTNMAVEQVHARRGFQPLNFHDDSRVIRLYAEQVGSIESLHYHEIAPKPETLDGDRVEIKVEAAGVNFKDVAITLGLIPENEHLLGGEGSGVVTRVAPGVSNVKLGQRVAFFERGSFGNTITTTTKLLQRIPDTMTFVEAATIPCAFMTSMHCLFNLGGVKAGDRVLIHSATGGVGIAAIQLCQYVGATVFATVGSQEKQDFLVSSFRIPHERIFSSRTRAFAKQILNHTDGRGVDFILNSLTGDLLDESWRIIADGGTMVEIGKKDILDKGLLSMGPFIRNATFRSFDLSYKEMDDDRKAYLLSEIFRLLRQGSLKPISPIHQFSFAEIPAALRYIGSAKHIGKLVITDNSASVAYLHVRPPRTLLRLKEDVTYLVIGGLRGLCGTIALSLASNGARHLAIMSRSIHDDPGSQKIKEDIQAQGCRVSFVRGDVTQLEDVRDVFRTTTPPICGVIQGAMVLRDRTFDSMTLEEFHEAMNCKVQGTWNIHNVSLEQSSSLDFFTLLSSVSGVCGNKGQANYAAANTFLDAFAVYRRSLKLNACSISLGVANNRGYLAEHQNLRQNFDSAIWYGIGEKLLRQILDYSIQQQKPDASGLSGTAHLITGIQVPQPRDSHLLYDPRFSALLSRDSGVERQQSKDGSQDVRALLLALRSKADAKTVLGLMIEVCDSYLVKSLRMSTSLDPTRPLSDYGVDSLVAVEFRGRFFAKFHLRKGPGTNRTLKCVVGVETGPLHCATQDVLEKLAIDRGFGTKTRRQVDEFG
ncbi:putative Polyketide synthase [Seiridium unicorne]|uniref:Polyketide synthase n=1 Tax=Seiridium unicorne TaxID=138068 RepID=A0ABR2ULS4_9PEZI